MSTAGPALVDDPLGLVARSHPIRESLSQEMHLRRLPRFAAPARLLQIVILLEDDAADIAGALLGELRPPVPPGARHALFEMGRLHGVLERHAEFLTLGFLLPGAFDDPFDPADFAEARPLIDRLPRTVIRSTLVALASGGDEATLAAQAITRFGEDGLVVCDVDASKARLWSDFRLAADGLGHLLVMDRGLVGDEPAHLIQRLQELGNYRNMALLGLPVAQRLMPALGRLEDRLAALTVDVGEPGAANDLLLEELTALSAELARMVAETRYRMSATEAYAKIVEERLIRLDVTPLPGHQTLTDFTDRRLMPAVRTCATVSKRLDDLSQRAAWTSSLLRTRIDIALARQNRDLLHSMDRRTKLQLRLQQAVEGLSVVAISYYLVALIGDVVKPIPSLPHDIVMAVAAPLIVVVVALLLARMKKQLLRD